MLSLFCNGIKLSYLLDPIKKRVVWSSPRSPFPCFRWWQPELRGWFNLQSYVTGPAPLLPELTTLPALPQTASGPLSAGAKRWPGVSQTSGSARPILEILFFTDLTCVLGVVTIEKIATDILNSNTHSRLHVIFDNSSAVSVSVFLKTTNITYWD